jgi:hypothetical protein
MVVSLVDRITVSDWSVMGICAESCDYLFIVALCDRHSPFGGAT